MKKLNTLATLLVTVSPIVKSATVEVHEPKEAIEALALEAIAKMCRDSEKLTLEQRLEMSALEKHYRSARYALGVEYDLDLVKLATKQYLKDNPTDIKSLYVGCSFYLKK